MLFRRSYASISAHKYKISNKFRFGNIFTCTKAKKNQDRSHLYIGIFYFQQKKNHHPIRNIKHVLYYNNPSIWNQVTLYILLFGSKLNIKKNVEHFSETCYFGSKERKIFIIKKHSTSNTIHVTWNNGIWGGLMAGFLFIWKRTIFFWYVRRFSFFFN